MTDPQLINDYNYDEFIPEKFERWLNFASSLPLGVKTPDFDLWRMDKSQTSLLQEIQNYKFTFVEFGSFT